MKAAEASAGSANRYTPALAVASVIGAMMLPAGAAGTPKPLATESAGLGDCAPYFNLSRYQNHEYEACTAYVVNSAEVALQGYYKFGNNQSRTLARTANHHFETRYWMTPRRTIQRDVGSWPLTGSPTGNRVKEKIDVVSVESSLPQDRALLETRESWQVTSPGGKVLHTEPRHSRDVTMCRGKLPGAHLLHEWFIVKFDRDPTFNCTGFDKQHGIKS